jgi:hypothetical protein
MKTLKLYNVGVSLKNLKMKLPVAAVSNAAAKRQAAAYYRAATIGSARQIGVVNVPEAV